MTQDKFEIVLLARAHEILSAFSAAELIDTGMAPPRDQVCGLLRLRAVPGVQQSRRHPGASHLILAAELSAGSGAQYGDPVVPSKDVPRHRGSVPQAGQVDRLAAHGIEQQLRARRGHEHHRAMHVLSRADLHGTVRHVESVRHVAAELADQKRLLQRRRDYRGVIGRFRRENAPSHADGRGRHRGCANHVHNYDGVSIAVTLRALGKTIDDNGTLHEPPHPLGPLRTAMNADL